MGSLVGTVERSAALGALRVRIQIFLKIVKMADIAKDRLVNTSSPGNDGTFYYFIFLCTGDQHYVPYTLLLIS